MKYKKVVIILFFAFLLFPGMSFPLTRQFLDTEMSENRKLAEKPILNWETWDTYPQNYETFFMDHLPYKKQLVSFYQSLDYIMFHEIPTDKVSLGKDNWLFYLGEPGEDPIADYQGTNLFTQDELDTIKSNLEKVDDYFSKRNIEFVLMAAPNKEQIYSEKMSDAYKIINKEKRYDQLINYLIHNTKIMIIDPKDELLREKQHYQVYYRYDSHWNQLGAFIASQQLIAKLKDQRRFLSDVHIISEEQTAEDLITMTNLPKYFTDDPEYIINDYEPDVQTDLLKQSDDRFLIEYASQAKDKRHLFVVRDSFGEGLIRYLSKDFSHTTFLHRNAYHINYVNDADPDILVYEIVERNLDLLKNDGLNLLPSES